VLVTGGPYVWAAAILIGLYLLEAADLDPAARTAAVTWASPRPPPTWSRRLLRQPSPPPLNSKKSRNGGQLAREGHRPEVPGQLLAGAPRRRWGCRRPSWRRPGRTHGSAAAPWPAWSPTASPGPCPPAPPRSPLNPAPDHRGRPAPALLSRWSRRPPGGS